MQVLYYVNGFLIIICAFLCKLRENDVYICVHGSNLSS